MEPQNKLRMEIVENGKVLKHVRTDQSHSGQEGHYTDVYKDEDGNLHYVDRIANTIRFSSHSRRTGDGNMISFSITFKQMLEGLQDNCSEEELDKLILKCEHPLGKAVEFYKKESPENHDDLFYNALNEKISEKVTEFTFGEITPSIIASLERALNAPRMQNNPALHNAIQLEIFNLKNPEVEPELN